MKLPVHTNPTREVARAPYNFVPLPETVVTIDPNTLPDQDRYYPDRHTGYIDCTITTESPTFMRAPLTPEEFARQEAGEESSPWREQIRNKPDFFYADPAKTPRIPGSSLRGMLRQLVEIVSYGKMEFVSAQKLVYRSVGDTTSHGEEYRKRVMHYDGETSNRSGKRTKQYTPLVKAGYIQERYGSFVIQPAREIGGTTFARIRIDDIPRGMERVAGCKNASHIYFQPGPYDYQDVRGGFLRIKYSKVLRVSSQEGPGLMRGTLAVSGGMASKRSEVVVFPVDEAAPVVRINDKLIKSYKNQLSQEQRQLLGEQGVLNEGQPVFYIIEKGELAFFGHTMMMRLPYPKSPRDFIPGAVRNEDSLDLAGALFGFTNIKGEGKARAYASRVQVGDAILGQGQSDFWLAPDQVITPKILGGPKPTTFQHYLTQQSPDSKEQGRYRDGRPKLIKELADYTASTPAESVLRGHKLYWHKGSAAASDLQEAPDKLLDAKGRENDRDTQHTQMRPLAAGVRFHTCIRFENLSNEELGALLWALTLPGRPGQEYRHSIGMGKPYGMGAVKLEPTLTLEDRRRRYGAIFGGTGWLEGSEDSSVRIPEFVGAFDHFIRREIGAQDASTLAEIERIQMLLKLLEWPGPDKELTRYLEIERQDPRIKRGKVNEYKGRPVLPDPLHIENAQRREQRQQARPTALDRPKGSRTPTDPTTSTKETVGRSLETPKPAPAPRTQVIELSHPTSIDEVVDGMYLEGKVVRVEPGRVVVEILGEEASLALQNIFPAPRDQYDLDERFPTDKLIKVFVLRRNKKGRLQVKMQPS
ncbi:MAG: TIGR03986 family CRISPR-associated RAMP protein [Anaerolineae bacterium]|nr:TIGR03986 family CRISPR-associated RAMP protein [Anaerolineae bacterium]